jgi:hypothetical protein
MIQGQVRSVKSIIAILAFVFIPQKDIAPRKGWFLVDMRHVVRQGNDGRQGHLNIGGSDGNVRVNVHDGYFPTENRLDRVLPRPKAQWKVA